MIGWFNPLVLAATALSDVVAATFGTFADKRDQQAALPRPPRLGLEERDELWIDYTSDLGDAFAPTMAVAWHLAQPELELADLPAPLPRAELLVLGGDEVYPVGSVERYEDQTVGPYRTAFPESGDSSAIMLALPGNHDWYDGLTGFLRVFCQGRHIGGWRTAQTRSYFSVELPHGWWLWAVDTQLGGWIDQPQLAYFDEEAKRMQPGDRLIMATPEPTWLYEPWKPGASKSIDWFVARHVPDGVTVPLYITGDLHHYAHYATGDGEEHRLTVGGGGAFTHPTHHLDESVAYDDRFARRQATLTRGVVYPEPKTSRLQSLRVALLAFFNPIFSLFLGAVVFGLAWLAQAAVRGPYDDLRSTMRSLGTGRAIEALVRSPMALLLAVVVLVAWTAFSRLAMTKRRRLSFVLGFLHGLAHLYLVVCVILFAADLAPGRGVAYGLAFAALTIVGGGLAAGTLAGLYLLLTNVVFAMHDNEVFSAIRLRSHKCFVRLHIATDGSLTVYPIGIDDSGPHEWPVVRDGGRPRFEKPASVTVRLIEPPFIVGPAIGDSAL